MITFLTSPRPFRNSFDALQRMAIQSWLAAVPGCQVILMGDPPGAREAVRALGVTQCLDVATNAQATPLVNSILALGDRYAMHGWLCWVNSDITLDVDLVAATRALADCTRPFVVGQRWDIDPGADASTAVLHPPSGIDYVLYRRGTLPAWDMPPFAIGKTAYDNWIVWAAMTRWQMTVIDATAAITAIHVNHEHPEYGDKTGLYASGERAENIRLAQATGCPRWYGIDDAPWVLRDGALEARNGHV